MNLVAANVKWRHLSPSAKRPPRHRGGSGSWSQCALKKASGLSMNRNAQIRRTNDEIRRNTEIRRTNEPLHTRALFDIRASDFFRHLSFVIRHLALVHGPNAFEKTNGGFPRTAPPCPLTRFGREAGVPQTGRAGSCQMVCYLQSPVRI